MNHEFLTPEEIQELKNQNAKVLLVDSDIPCYSIGFMAKDDSSPKHVENSVDNFLLKMKRKLEATHYICFLTDGRSNFRNKAASTVAYKGNRADLERPKWYPHIKQYLGDKWKAQTMFGIEADDALTIAATYLQSHGIQCIICSLDKDLRQMDTLHYNWDSGKITKVTPEQGEYNLWKQVLTGDVATDNIPGLSESAWVPKEPFKTPVFESYLRVPTEGPHLTTILRPIKVTGGEPKVVQPMVPKGKTIVSSRGLKVFGGNYLDYFDNILDANGVCQGAYCALEQHTPAPIEMSHVRLKGWNTVEDLTYVRPLGEDLYGDVASEELLQGHKVTEYPSVVLKEYIDCYWAEGYVQELEDPAELGIKRFNEVFSLIYMLRTVDEIPEEVRDTVAISFKPLVFQAKDYDDFDGDDTDADDPDFDF